ncbi:MAG TPA: S-ribosylhomocysteine lyase [Ruminococcaceae bacterium]|nr:S-ribosylhomocysteine lyase [Oscillospiraceae bacterium]
MKKIASFTIDHTILPCGMYTSRVDGDVVTYDIRCRRPNVEEVMDNASIHTVEHLFATFVRNTPLSEGVIYFGPMGCRTGFYFLVRSSMISDEQAIEMTRQAFAFIANYDGEIPGVSAAECGNYRDHSLPGAKKEAQRMISVMDGVSVASLKYPEK